MVNREKFEAYVKVQRSGVTNMFAISTVTKVTMMVYGVELTKEDCLYIMKNYSILKEKYKK